MVKVRSLLAVILWLLSCKLFCGPTNLAVRSRIEHMDEVLFDFRHHTINMSNYRDSLNRIFLWCVPRTLSTVFLKCLSFVDGVQVVNEPYNCAFRAGPERKNPERDLNNPVERRLIEIYDYKHIGEEVPGFDTEVCTYGWIRDQLLGASYEGKKILLCKDIAYYLDAKYDMLPQGFRHSFLIRHPAKVFLSWKKNWQKLFGESCAQQMENLRKLPESLFPAGCGFRELYELLEYVKKNLDPEPVIVDTDDLLADPAGILSAYCGQMGIPYSPELLSWEAGDAVTTTWITPKTLVSANRFGGFLNAALESSGFGHPGPVPSFESLPADVQDCVRASMCYYERLHERRIKPSPAYNDNQNVQNSG